VPSGITWHAAKNAAESQSYSGVHGHLATITSQGENDFILSNLGGENIKGCWIGAIQPAGSPEPDGGWQWVTGERWDFTYWIGPPNNHYGGDQGVHPYGYGENAVQVNWWDNSGKWNDFPDDIPMYGYIVEFETMNIQATPTIQSIPDTIQGTPAVVGLWHINNGASLYTIYPNGSATNIQEGKEIGGHWEQKSQYDFVWYWNHGYTDFIKISSDGKSYTGYNDRGQVISGIKIGELSVPSNPIIPQVFSTTSVSPEAVTDTPVHGDSNNASSPSENIFNNILLIPLIIVIIAIVVGYLSISRKKKYAAREEIGKTTSLNANPSENRSSATSSALTSPHHDVFISYAHQNKTIADAICGTLETNRIRCWIAPRDILPGMNYQESIIDAIDESRIMVLVYSSFTNNSPHITRELTRAVSKNVIIIPFRIEDVPLSKSMEYLISIPHWLDAMTPPLEVHLNKLSKDIQSILERIKS
jgi:hypothetical protein